MTESDHDHQWDIWRLDPTNYTLVAGVWHNYYVDLEECTTSARTLDWLIQVTNKSWATQTLLGGLLRAVDDVLRPQSTLCGMGESKHMTRDALRSRVASFANAHPELVATTEPETS